MNSSAKSPALTHLRFRVPSFDDGVLSLLNWLYSFSSIIRRTLEWLMSSSSAILRGSVCTGCLLRWYFFVNNLGIFLSCSSSRTARSWTSIHRSGLFVFPDESSYWWLYPPFWRMFFPYSIRIPALLIVVISNDSFIFVREWWHFLFQAARGDFEQIVRQLTANPSPTDCKPFCQLIFQCRNPRLAIDCLRKCDVKLAKKSCNIIKLYDEIQTILNDRCRDAQI